MDTKRLILIGGLAVAALVVFTQAKKLGTPAPVAPTRAAAPVIQKVEYVKVLVAAQNLGLGARLTEAAYEWKQWPKEAVSPAFISKLFQRQLKAALLVSGQRQHLKCHKQIQSFYKKLLPKVISVGSLNKSRS